MDSIVCKSKKINILNVNEALKILFKYGKDIVEPFNAVYTLQEVGKSLLNINLKFNGATFHKKTITKTDIYNSLKILINNGIHANDSGNVLQQIGIKLINVDLGPLIIK